jgi:hypothetical protein
MFTPGTAAVSAWASASGVLPADQFWLRNVLVCAGCGHRLYPAGLAAGARAYADTCGCRLRPVDADIVEAVVRERLLQRLPADGDPVLTLDGLVRQWVSTVRVGCSAGEVTCEWHI